MQREFVYISHADNSPWIVEFNESERRASTIFQVNESNFTEFVEKILDVLRTNIRWQIAHVYSTLIPAAVRHRTYTISCRADDVLSYSVCGVFAESK